MDPIKEKELIEQAKNGQPDAYGKLIEHYQKRLYRRVVALLGDGDLAQDTLQASLLTAYYHIKKFRGDSSIYTWLYRIVTNKCKDTLLLKKKEQIYSIDKLELGPILIDEKINLQKNLELSETSQYLMDKVNALPEKYRNIVFYRYYDDMSYEQIANLSHIRVGTVKSRLFKARDLLYKSVCEDGKQDLIED